MSIELYKEQILTCGLHMRGIAFLQNIILDHSRVKNYSVNLNILFQGNNSFQLTPQLTVLILKVICHEHEQ